MPDFKAAIADKFQNQAQSMLNSVAAAGPKLSALCNRYGVRRLDLVGSAASGRFDAAASDLDFLVDFEPMDPAAYADSYFGLREGLQSVFGREIDLVTEVSVANPFFRDFSGLRAADIVPAPMTSREARKYLWDARQAAERLRTVHDGPHLR